MPAMSIGATSVMLCGTVNPNGLETTYSFVSGAANENSQDYFPKTPARQAGSAHHAASVTANISGLLPNLRYYYKIQAKNSAGESVGALVHFNTTAAPGALPTVTTQEAPSVSDTSATLHGVINPNGTSAKYEFFSCHEAGSEGIFAHLPVPMKDIGNGTYPVGVAETLTKLKSDTVYHYALKAENQRGTKIGECLKFKTLPAAAGLPYVWTSSPPDVLQPTYARLRGRVNPRGLETTVWFESCASGPQELGYFPPTEKVILPRGFEIQEIYIDVSKLFPGENYKYKIRAKNKVGTETGDCMSFKTLVEPGKIYVETLPATDITATSATLHANAYTLGTNTDIQFVCGLPGQDCFRNQSTRLTSVGLHPNMSLTVYGLKPETTYSYSVHAYDQSRRSADGAKVVFTTLRAK